MLENLDKLKVPRRMRNRVLLVPINRSAGPQLKPKPHLDSNYDKCVDFTKIKIKWRQTNEETRVVVVMEENQSRINQNHNQNRNNQDHNNQKFSPPPLIKCWSVWFLTISGALESSRRVSDSYRLRMLESPKKDKVVPRRQVEADFDSYWERVHPSGCQPSLSLLPRKSFHHHPLFSIWSQLPLSSNESIIGYLSEDNVTWPLHILIHKNWNGCD